MSKRERMIWQFVEAAVYASCLVPVVASLFALTAA